jgi:hypothetical protein
MEAFVPRKIVWTDGQDAQIRRLRTEGAVWDAIAQVLGLARCTVIERARALGCEQPPAHAAIALHDVDRAALPSGHAESWETINRGTSLEGVRFKTPNSVR